MEALYEVSRTYAPLLGRILIAVIFVQSACDKAVNYSKNAAVMTVKGIPMAGVLLAPSIAIMFCGGLMVLLGWHARLGALALLVFMLTALPFYHPYWNASPEQRMNELLHFMKNLGLIGAMLYIIGMGSGPLSLSNR